jgi:hypothetical protein
MENKELATEKPNQTPGHDNRAGAKTANDSRTDSSSTIREGQGQNARKEQGQRRSHRRRSKSSRQLAKVNRTSRNLKIALTTVIMILTTVVVIGKQAQTRLEREYQHLQRTLEKQQLSLVKAKELNKKLLADMDTMVESRLPGLQPMEFDTVILISKGYVKNLIFVVSKDSRKTSYEYRLVFFNANATPVVPRTKLHLFNDRGIEIGNADVTVSAEASDGLGRALAPGEIRSYNGSITVGGNSPPRYFLLDMD